METKYFVAFDLGATSGRTILGMLEGEKLTLEEVTRFPNQTLELGGHYYWNIYSLYESLKKGLAEVAKLKVPVTSIGIDTWGVDFVCLNAAGDIIGLPYAYRDQHTAGMKERLFERVMPADEVYARTGIQHIDYNTLYQLYSMAQREDFNLVNAKRALFTPDALSYLLTGNMVTEYTIASTGQILNPYTRQIDGTLLEKAGIDPALFSPIVEPGHVIGPLRPQLCEELQIGPIPVVAVAGHDTASAVAAIPASGSDFAYLSSGTWSLMGVEARGPVINQKTTSYNITNEGGVCGTIRLLKNITGMWIVEQCLKKWRREGSDYSYPQMVALANAAEPFVCFIDPESPIFTNPTDMVKAIDAYCVNTRQRGPETHGQYIRTIFESLALKYRETLDTFLKLADHPINKLHIIGGGSRNALLNQFTANAIGLPVLAGPSEATSIGNIMMQAMAAGAVGSLEEMREVISANVKPYEYNPADGAVWDEAYQRYQAATATRQ